MDPETREKETKQIILLIRRLMQAGEHYSKELEKKYHVSTPQLACLKALHEHGPMPLSRIAKKIMVNSSTVTGIIDRLEAKDLVRRVRDRRDRRQITIELTPDGVELAQKAPLPIQQNILEGLQSLSEQDFKNVLYGLNKLVSFLGPDFETPV